MSVLNPFRYSEPVPPSELIDRDDAIVRVEATGVCGSDLHIYHGRVSMEQGFTLGHEFVGTVVAAGDGVTQVAEGEVGEFGRLVPEDLGRRLAPVVPLQQGGQVVRGAASGKGAPPGPRRFGGTGQEPALLVAGGRERHQVGDQVGALGP